MAFVIAYEVGGSGLGPNVRAGVISGTGVGVAFGASEAGAIDASVGAGLAVASSVGVGVTVGSVLGLSRAASADCAPKSKLAPTTATSTITATPAATTLLGRGSGITPRRNGSSTKNQLAVATGMDRSARATAWPGVSHGLSGVVR